MTQIKLPQNSIKYILFQRTGYLKNDYLFKFLTLIGQLKQFYRLSVKLKSFLFSARIKKEFNEDMQREFSTIKQFLPRNISSILDIGCGMAGIDVLISGHYQNKINVFLVDKTQTDDMIHYDFEKMGSFYNSLQISKKLLDLNGVNSNKIFLQETTQDNKITFKQSFDVIISLLSWGFHYPISTYLYTVYNKLNKNGLLIVDIRKNTNGEKEINKKFGNYEIILDTKKFIRVLARK